jgi:hypothetical protein
MNYRIVGAAGKIYGPIMGLVLSGANLRFSLGAVALQWALNPGAVNW